MLTIVLSSMEIDSLPLSFKRSIQNKYTREPILGQMRLCSMGLIMQAKEVPGTIREKEVRSVNAIIPELSQIYPEIDWLVIRAKGSGEGSKGKANPIVWYL